MPSIRTHLWFDHEAEEALTFYASIFPNSKVLSGTVLGEPVPDGGEQPIAFYDAELNGMRITALNAGSAAPFNERVSLYVETEDQAETDRYWNALIAGGGEEKPCGWLTDRFGVYWQVIPKRMIELLSDPDRAKSDRAMQAMYKMKKIIIADIEAAANARRAA